MMNGVLSLRPVKHTAMLENLFAAAERCLAAADPDEKIFHGKATASAWQTGRLSLQPLPDAVLMTDPGRPPKPELVHPREVPRRSIGTLAGRAALLHAIAHIEFNAINLAWDAVYRFRHMPQAYYADWIKVATEEAEHFMLLRNRLRKLDHDYGDFPAHDGLWEMARKTAPDPLLRMALVPRVLEARGLDVTPGMIGRLQQANDTESTAVLNIILRDEIGHVAIGSRWFHYLCAQRRLAPEATFRSLLQQYLGAPLRGPFNEKARLQAGFSAAELATLRADASA